MEYQLTGDSGPENKGVKNWSEIISVYLLHYLRNQQKPSLAALKNIPVPFQISQPYFRFRLSKEEWTSKFCLNFLTT